MNKKGDAINEKDGTVLHSLPVDCWAFSNGSLAQEYARWHLPAGAIARLGKGTLSDAKFSPDGTQLAVATSVGVWVYDARTGAEIALLNKHPKNVRTVAFSRMVKCLLLAVGPGTAQFNYGTPPLAHTYPPWGKVQVQLKC